jgi:hypothetical protein
LHPSILVFYWVGGGPPFDLSNFFSNIFNTRFYPQMEQPIIAEESFYQRMDKIYEWEDRGAFTTRSW